MRYLLIVISVFITLQSFGQCDDCFFDKKTKTRRFKSDSSLYKGVCECFYRNGNKEFEGVYEKGKVLISKRWSKKGILKEYDSAYYVNGRYVLDNHVFNSQGELQYKSTVFDDSIISRKYIDNVLIEESTFPRKGILITGKTKYFRSDGSIEKVEQLKKGLVHGITRLYASDGFLEEEQTYKRNNFVNPAIKYDREGNKYEIIYSIKSGKPVREKKRKKID